MQASPTREASGDRMENRQTKYKIAWLPGDGIGVDVLDATGEPRARIIKTYHLAEKPTDDARHDLRIELRVENIDAAPAISARVPDELGADWALSRLTALQDEYGEDRYRPSAMLRRLARERARFHI